ncbi:hypothetical protein MX003_04545 [Streptococcus uberis]|uniref:hypothetical protein n=1 Tax=Streptococcus uberis TaxID=1349 RepID=UPI000542D1F0|nr:hypothetical protein [Streptococcus uberis]KHD40481.1 hypothetical protein NA32_05275 [Streptococcus hongkongensis]KKF41185.1 hypothetical protein AF61_00860 [Streptococcus uberis EF20/0145]MCK1201907.1 hypothetical protein [Streptococcus uberis]MCK1207339.1 hypothetical protein [Streptococcus uberis]MCK1236959.1 hypothetical protein [Streptococcus uberis]
MYFLISLIFTFIIAYVIGNTQKDNKLLNYLLLFFLLTDIYYVGKYLIKYIPIFINHTIKYLQNMTSSLDAVVLVALITGSISILISIFSRYYDNRNKRREYLSAKREVPYSEFIELVYKMTQNGSNGFSYSQEEMIKDISSFNSKLSLWGSPKVVKKWNAFRKSSLEVKSEDDPELLILMEEVMNEMRKDLGVKSVGKGSLLSFFINDIENVVKKSK